MYRAAENAEISDSCQTPGSDGSIAPDEELRLSITQKRICVWSWQDHSQVVGVLGCGDDGAVVWGQVLAGLRQLQPRLYSISSAQREGATRVAVTVAVVRYDALGRNRVGVASTLLAERLQVPLPSLVSCRHPEVTRLHLIPLSHRARQHVCAPCKFCKMYKGTTLHLPWGHGAPDGMPLWASLGMAMHCGIPPAARRGCGQ